MFSSSRMQLTSVLVRRDARLLRPHITRGLLVLALWFVAWQFADQAWRQAAGRDLLAALTFYSALGLVLAATLGFTSVFTDDWTASNLDLLRITGLSAFDLILAKSIPHAITAATLIVIQLPFALVCVTLGGVTLVQIAALAVELAVLFLLASGCAVICGVQVSAGGLSPKWARVLAFLLLGFLLFLLGVTDQMLAEVAWAPRGVPRGAARAAVDVPWLNPVSELRRILSSGFRGPPVNWTLLAHAAGTAIAFGIAGASLRSRWHVAGEDNSPTEPQPAELEAPPLWRPVVPPPRCTGNAIAWKEYYFTLGGDEMMNGKWGLMLFLSPLLLFMLVGPALDANIWGFAVLAEFVVIVGAVGSLNYTARRLWQTEIQERTLWGLAVLPLSAEEILRAKLASLAWVSIPEMIVLSVATLLPLLHGSMAGTALIGGMFASLPLVVCTDAGWRFIPASWEGLTARAKLVGVVVATWSLAGLLGGFVHPLAGLATIVLTVPLATWVALDEAARWFAWRAGEAAD
uniref:Uncharacterized protein n=1 Tax=Schlesneria paludicola TaxID=360056 RepID=A0A7C2P0J3_9PLAN